MTYDPNFVGEGDNEAEEEEDFGDWGSEGDDDMNDDDLVDNSWTVRRGAVHLIDAVIKAKPEF